MEIKNYFAQDAQGNIMPSANCYLYFPGTTNLATGLVDGNGVPISNPFLASGMGQITFGAPNGVYDLRIAQGARDFTIEIQCADLLQALNETASFLGAKSSAPTTRNDGSALQIADRYFNTSEQLEYLYKSTGWVANNLDGQLLATSQGASLIGALMQDGSSGTIQDAINSGDKSLRQDLGTPAAVAKIIAVPQRFNFTNPLLDAAINGFEISLSLFADPGTQLVTDGSVSTRAPWLRGLTASIEFDFTLAPPPGVYLWDTGIPLSVAVGKSLSIHGQGRINTHIIVGDLTKPALKVTGPTTGFPLSLKGFKFGRLSKETFTQQKLMLIEYPDNFDISGLELYNSVGWALQLSYSKNGAVRDSLVRDGFLGQASDGVHIYREAFNIDIINVEARNLGDDAFSVGHGQADGKFCEGVRFINCKAYNTNGIKIYGACKDIQVLNPHVKLAKYGVSINTYEDVAGAAQGASDILIDGGTLEDITLGAGDQGAITALWNTGTGSGNLKGLTVKGTKIKNTRAGIVCLGQASKKIENLTLKDVTIDGVTGAGVRTDFTSGTLKVKNVTANGVGNQAFYFYNTDATDLWELDGLMANGFGLGSVNVYNGIWLRGNPGRLLMTDCTYLNGNNTTVKSVEMGNVTNSAKHFVLNNRGTGGSNMSAGGTLFSPASGQADGTRFVELTP